MWNSARGLTTMAAAAAAAGLAGCASPPAPTPPAPDATLPVSAATVVPVSAVVNQLKCDVGVFLKSQETRASVFTVYNVTGTLTFSLDRSTTGGWSVALAPSFPLSPLGGVSGAFGRSKSTTHDVGDDVILKFDMQAQPDPADDPHAVAAVDQGACDHGLGGGTHIIEPEALRRQVEGVVLGAPKIGFSTVEYKGKFLLKRSDDQKNSVSLYIVSASLPGDQQDSSYTQQFDITLDLQPPKPPGKPAPEKPAPPPSGDAGAPHPVHPPMRHMAPPPPARSYGLAPREAAPPQLGSSGPVPETRAGGLSEHLKRLTDAIPDAPPH